MYYVECFEHAAVIVEFMMRRKELCVFVNSIKSDKIILI